MKILVTGSEGFVGRHVVKMLRKLEQDVTGVDMLLEQVHGDAIPVPLYKFHAHRVGTHFVDTTYDAIIHLAAHVGVGQSMQYPVDYVDRNTLDTAMMLEGFGKYKPRKLIVASSMSVYGEGATYDDGSPKPTPETHPVNPQSVYALTKYDQEQLCLMWGKANRVPAVALRFFNIYGPGQSLQNPYTGVLSIFTTRLLNGNAPVIYEDGQQTRDFVHVEDVARAVVHAALDERVEHGVYNVGTGVARTIESVAESLAHAIGVGIKPNITHQKRAGDIRHCYADITRMVNTGWTPRVTFNQGLRDYVDWLRTQNKPVDNFEKAESELQQAGLLQ